MPNVIHFEVAVDKMERAARFYKKVFNWKIESEDEADSYRSIETDTDDDPGITGGMIQRTDPADSTVVTIDVDSVDACARKITEAGGKVLAPKVSIPNVGYLQYCEDTEGNIFAIMELDEAAE
jgi:uncharacterized protein